MARSESDSSRLSRTIGPSPEWSAIGHPGHLERAQALLAAIVDSSEDAIVSKTLDGTILSWNAGAQRLFGYTAEEAVGQPVRMIIPPELQDQEDLILECLRRGERIEHFETVRIAKDGRRLDVSLTVSPVRDGAGRIVAASKVARDITDRKRSETLVREQKENLHALLETLPVAVFIAEDPECRRITGNLAASRLLRMPSEANFSETVPDNELSARFRVLKDGKEVPIGDLPIQRAARGAIVMGEEVDLELDDGTTLHVVVSAQPLYDAGGATRGAVAGILDITELHAAKASLREADRRKDEFLATLAHELRNPLAPICNSLHVLRMTGGSGAAAERVLDMVERQVAHMVRLVDDLLELSRISRGALELKKEYIEIASVIRHAIETSRPMIESAGHLLEVSLPEEPLVVCGDSIRLSQIFTNLLNNAAKYTENGGRITVRAVREGGDVAVSVRDTGIGIPRDMLPRVFEMFARGPSLVRQAKDGLGIGLSLVRTLVTAHGGTVTASSGGASRGSEFVVRLALADPEGTGTAQGRGRSETLIVPPVQRILVVDDNRDAADSLAMLLGLTGSAVQVAYDGASAIELARVASPSIVFLDLDMPGFNGYEVAQRLRADPRYDGLVLIALTGLGLAGSRRASLDAGFDHHLVKPVDFGVLQALLESLQGTPVPASSRS